MNNLRSVKLTITLNNNESLMITGSFTRFLRGSSHKTQGCDLNVFKQCVYIEQSEVALDKGHDHLWHVKYIHCYHSNFKTSNSIKHYKHTVYIIYIMTTMRSMTTNYKTCNIFYTTVLSGPRI